MYRSRGVPTPSGHVAFDLDGTLADTATDIAAAVNATLAALGRPPLPQDAITAFVGEGARRLLERVLGRPAEDLLDRALARFLDHYGRHLLDTTRVYPGIPALLAELTRRGVACTVLTNKPERMSRAVVAGLGLARWIAAVVGGDSLPTRKPDPQGLRHLCALVGVPVERSLLVGDSLVDAETARRAGAAFCGVTWGFGGAALLAAGVEPLVSDPGGVLALAAAAGLHEGHGERGAARRDA